MRNNRAYASLEWECMTCHVEYNYIWYSQCYDCGQKPVNEKMLELNIDVIYSNKTAMDKSDFINMIHDIHATTFQNILNRIETFDTTQKQHVVNNYCRIIGIQFDVIQLVIIFLCQC